jgi:hypothetical protein
VAVGDEGVVTEIGEGVSRRGRHDPIITRGALAVSRRARSTIGATAD